MEKQELKKILENYLETLSKISTNESFLMENPLLLYVLTESFKTVTITLFFLNKN